jgi:ABC-type nickel/cobalt efflux system permease component RcnA
VWIFSTFTLPMHVLDPTEDGVQFSLPLLITTTATEDALSQFLFIVWYIWKARNDVRFQRKNWTSFQVLRVAQAHKQTHISALEHQHQHQPAATHQQHSTPQNTNPFSCFQFVLQG